MRSEERWKDIPGYEGLYQASSFGRVKALPQKIMSKNRGEVMRAAYTLTPMRVGDFERSVFLRKGNRVKQFDAADLATAAFAEDDGGSDPEQTPEKPTAPRKSSYRGVSWNKQRGNWMANIYVKNKRKYIGSYDSEKEAHEAYQDYARALGRI